MCFVSSHPLLCNKTNEQKLKHATTIVKNACERGLFLEDKTTKNIIVSVIQNIHKLFATGLKQTTIISNDPIVYEINKCTHLCSEFSSKQERARITMIQKHQSEFLSLK